MGIMEVSSSKRHASRSSSQELREPRRPRKIRVCCNLIARHTAAGQQLGQQGLRIRIPPPAGQHAREVEPEVRGGGGQSTVWGVSSVARTRTLSGNLLLSQARSRSPRVLAARACNTGLLQLLLLPRCCSQQPPPPDFKPDCCRSAPPPALPSPDVAALLQAPHPLRRLQGLRVARCRRLPV